VAALDHRQRKHLTIASHWQHWRIYLPVCAVSGCNGKVFIGFESQGIVKHSLTQLILLPSAAEQINIDGNDFNVRNTCSVVFRNIMCFYNTNK
jgi:hypothetical protein